MTISAATDYLGKIVTITIDRSLHSKHPKHGFVYELNYGFVPNTTAPDGEELDAYILILTLPNALDRSMSRVSRNDRNAPRCRI
jgi:inorganic pyrophosphatase